QYTLAEAARAKADGISLLVIGIGRNVRMSELSLIADNSSHAIHLNDFEDLNGDAALQRLTDAMQGFKQTPAPNTRSTIATHPRQSTTTTTYPRQSTTTTTYPRQSTTTAMAQPTTTKTVSTNFSWQCSFENATGRGSLCGMTQSSSDNFDWTLKSGRTPSSQTGPNSAYGGSGYYIFIEASNPRQMNDTAMIMLPSFNEDGDYCLSFYYNMNGFHINTLQVVNRHSSGLLVNLWMKKHHQGSQWNAAQVTANLHSSDLLAFIGIRGHEYSGDIAVDSISVRKGIC
ncbi:MAM and LDL-receptor class A domain-containing protein 2, partial [Lamellibrachia satsuma]